MQTYCDVSSKHTKDDLSINLKTSTETNQYNRTYRGKYFELASALVQTTDDGFALAGFTSYNLGYIDMWLVKVNSMGIHQWNQTYGGTFYEECYSLIQTTDGGFALTGCTTSFGTGNGDMWLLKTYPKRKPSYPFQILPVILLVISVSAALFLVFLSKQVQYRKQIPIDDIPIHTNKYVLVMSVNTLF